MNQAKTLMLSFIDWKFEKTLPEYSGVGRRLAREEIKRIFLDSLYAKTPNHPMSRQVRRRLARK